MKAFILAATLIGSAAFAAELQTVRLIRHRDGGGWSPVFAKCEISSASTVVSKPGKMVRIPGGLDAVRAAGGTQAVRQMLKAKTIRGEVVVYDAPVTRYVLQIKNHRQLPKTDLVFSTYAVGEIQTKRDAPAADLLVKKMNSVCDWAEKYLN